jgi:hypothetical protein
MLETCVHVRKVSWVQFMFLWGCMEMHNLSCSSMARTFHHYLHLIDRAVLDITVYYR